MAARRPRPRVKLDLQIVEAYYLSQALDAYIKSGVYGSNLPNWTELRDKVKAASLKAALEDKHGSAGGYRGNPEASVHLHRAGTMLKKARKQMNDALAAAKSQRPEKAATSAAEAYSSAVVAMDNMTDGSGQRMAHVRDPYQAAVGITREAMGVLRKIARAAAGSVKKKAGKKKSKAAGKAKPNPNASADRLRRKIARL